MTLLEIHLIVLVVCVTPSLLLCPRGYWPALVNTTGGKYGTERTFELHNVNPMDLPICQYCPNVGCYVVRREIEDEVETKKPITKSTLTTTTTTTEVTSTNYGVEPMDGEVLINGTKLSGNETGANNSSTEEEPVNYKLFMSCDPWSRMPSPVDIVSYLDCVMIGEKDRYYLFIYEPRFKADRVPIVDCVDADFLAWIENGTQLLGLELGFRMRAIPPFLFRYHQRMMEDTQYICVDGSSLTNKSIPFADTERFPSNKLSQVVFRTTSLDRARRPPKTNDAQNQLPIHSIESVDACPEIVQHKPANITTTVDCQFSPRALPITSDSVDPKRALERCPFRIMSKRKKEPRRRKPHTGLVEELKVPPSVLSACLLVLVLLLTIGIIIAFCIMNAERLMLCHTRSRKRREREAALAQELAEQEAKEAAAAAAAEEEKRHNAWHPIYGRQGFIPPTMGGAFGAFTMRTIDVPSTQQGMYGGNTGEMSRFN